MIDVIIIGAGASGLFAGTNIPKDKEVLILEKNENPGNKLLLTGKGRCNFTNLNVNKSHYYGDSLDKLNVFFEKFGPNDIIKYLNGNSIETKEEDNGRMFLKSNKAKQLLDFLVEKNLELNHQIKTCESVISIAKDKDGYSVITKDGRFSCKKIIIACGGKSFPQIGGSDYIFQFSHENGISVASPIPVLSGIETIENLSVLSGSSVNADIIIKDKNGKILFDRNGVFLFTHRGISGPVIFNATLFLSSYYNRLKNLTIKLIIENKNITKRLLTYLKAPKHLKSYTLTLHPKDFKGWETAKVMAGGILLDEVNDFFELKKMPNIYIIGEALNITGETGGFNLQWCWTSAYICTNHLF